MNVSRVIEFSRVSVEETRFSATFHSITQQKIIREYSFRDQRSVGGLDSCGMTLTIANKKQFLMSSQLFKRDVSMEQSSLLMHSVACQKIRQNSFAGTGAGSIGWCA